MVEHVGLSGFLSIHNCSVLCMYLRSLYIVTQHAISKLIDGHTEIIDLAHHAYKHTLNIIPCFYLS